MTRTVSTLAVAAGALAVAVAGCTREQGERALDTLGAGVVATTSSAGPPTLDLYTLDPGDPTIVRTEARVTVDPPPTGRWSLDYSPDAVAAHLLAVDDAPDDPPEIILVDSRTGERQQTPLTKLATHVVTATPFDVASFLLIDGWWSDDDSYVLRAEIKPDMEQSDPLPPQNLLLRYELGEVDADDVPVLRDSTFMRVNDLPGEAPGGFAEKEHRFAAGNRLAVVGGALQVDGRPTSGGPSNVAQAVGVIFRNP